MKLQFMDPATVTLLWFDRLDPRVGKELESQLDSIEGVEEIHMFRYGAGIDIAPHVASDLERFGRQVVAALTMNIEPLLPGLSIDVGATSDADL